MNMFPKKVFSKLLGTTKYLSKYLLSSSLLIIYYKSFIRPHLAYGDIVYDNPGNENPKSMLEKGQYQACFAMTSAIQGISREDLYHELGDGSLCTRRWKKLFFFIR